MRGGYYGIVIVIVVDPPATQKRFHWPAFTSTSRDITAAGFGRILFLITVPAHLAGFAVEMRAYSAYPAEAEV